MSRHTIYLSEKQIHFINKILSVYIIQTELVKLNKQCDPKLPKFTSRLMEILKNNSYSTLSASGYTSTPLADDQHVLNYIAKLYSENFAYYEHLLMSRYAKL